MKEKALAVLSATAAAARADRVGAYLHACAPRRIQSVCRPQPFSAH